MIQSVNGRKVKSILQLRRTVRKRTRPIYTAFSAIAFFLGGVALVLEYSLEPSSHLDVQTVYKRSLDASNDTDSGPEATTFPNIGNYPKEIFTLKQLRQGAVILHTGGMIYMFIALAIVCDEFFVPALEVITDKLHLSQDVAGATFMAAGGSAPELFTSVAGLFLSKNSVGISTIIGSAVFNILFVIGVCGLVAKSVLQLTWWPLFRDSCFYSVSLIVLIISYLDWKIHYYEAIALLTCYASYVIFMVFNGKIEKKVKEKLCSRKEEESRASAVDLVPVSGNSNLVLVVNGGQVQVRLQNQEKKTRPMSSLKFRAGLLQLMIQTIDPLAEGKVEERAMQLKRMGMKHINPEPVQDSNGNVKGKEPGGEEGKNNHLSAPERNGRASVCSAKSQLTSVEIVENPSDIDSDSPLTDDHHIVDGSNNTQKKGDEPDKPNITANIKDSPTQSQSPGRSASGTSHNESPEEDEDSTPLDISWPKSHRKRITYVLLAPIIFPLWLTLPDTRRPDRKKYYVITFIGSILWIAFFSTMMVWWASILCVTIGLEIEIIGLTVLAAGTSVPDLLTSVIVARKGFGDMAISSSIGSNIFDITVGLPLPWLVGSLINIPNPFVRVDAEGLLCSIILLFCMLLVTIGSIAICRWKMGKVLGVFMVVLYCGFLAFSVLLAKGIVQCIEIKFT